MAALANTTQTTAGPERPRLPRVPARDSPLTPLTFLDRGVVLPATSPALAFARVREGREGREVVVRNSAGKNGAVVLSLGKVGDYARPSLHDRALLADIAKLPSLGPAQVAAAARAAARSGLAGRSALASAAAAGEAEAHAARLCLATMLAELAISGGAAGRLDAEAAEDPRGFSARHREAISLGASARRLSADGAVLAITNLAPLVALASRLVGLLPRLRAFASRANDQAGMLAEGAADDAGFSGAATAATLGFADRALRPVRDLLDAPLAAIAAHAANPTWPVKDLERATLVLDGWEWLLARWDGSANHGHTAEVRGIRAIATGIPPLPAELGDTAEARTAVRAPWRPTICASPGVNAQATLGYVRVAVP